MSTQFPVQLAFRIVAGACLLAPGCSDAVPVDARVSYAGLEASLASELRPPIVIGILADTTGAEGAAGRAFSDVLRARLEASSPLRERLVQVVVFDDRGDEAGVRGAALRLESDPGVLVAIVAPGRGRAAAAAELAYRTNVVCAGCDRSAVTREGSHALVGEGSAAEATAAWILAALHRTEQFETGALTAALRSTDPPPGYARFEGSAPPRDPTVFRRPKKDPRK
ncbi:MAG: hypothetical protein NTY35_09440 [Planctomycetota bacterium]|nr:hypothetical protein [Planctomycetota bacterium]